MATSATALATIIQKLSAKYKFDNDKAIAFLAMEELLPKKLLPKDTKSDSIWASKKAQELAELHNINPEGDGSGKNGKWTLSDVAKAMEKPSKEKLLVSPNALNLANENKLSLVGKKGSGKDGRILLKDVQKWIDDEDDDDKEDINISPRALQEAHELGMSDDEIASLQGSGKDGRILLEDIKKHSSSSEEDDDEE